MNKYQFQIMKKTLTVLLMIALLSSIFFPSSIAYSQESQPIQIDDSLYSLLENDGPKHRYIIGMKKSNSINHLQSFSSSILNKNEQFLHNPISEFTLLDMISAELTELEAMLLALDSNIEFVELDAPIRLASVTQSVYSGGEVLQILPWGHKAIGFDLLVEQEHIQKGAGIKIALLDTGVGNHYDIELQGGISFTSSSSFQDDHGHGTHVAGIIKASHNSYGIVGSAYDAELYSVKVLDSNGTGTYSQAISGIEWAIEKGMHIILMSFGGTEPSQALRRAVQLASDAGIIVIAAAGNSGTAQHFYPAYYPEVISVGAIDKHHAVTSFSNYGKTDLIAPGQNLVSTVLGDTYGVASGTSMAAAYIAGGMATLWSNHAEWSVNEVIDQIMNTATVTGVRGEGNGLINIARAIGVIDHDIPPIHTDDFDIAPYVGWSIYDSEIQPLSYNKVGDGQSILPGQSAYVSLYLEGDSDGANPHSEIRVRVFPINSPEIIFHEHRIENPQLNVEVSYIWNTSIWTIPGIYTIEFYYPAAPDFTDTFTIFVQQPNYPPSTSLTLASGNVYVEGENIRLFFSAIDPDGIQSMELKIKRDEVLIDTVDVLGMSEYELFIPVSGEYRIDLIAKDPSGMQGSSYVEFTVDIKRHVVVFVPGFMGTEIWRSSIGGAGAVKLFPSINPLNFPPLGLNPNGNSIVPTFTGEVFEDFEFSIPNLIHIYMDAGKKLFAALREQDVTVITAPYDWRKDLNIAASVDVASAVNEALIESRGQPITIISYSTGALPARKYLIDNPNAPVKYFINIAGANLGTPRAMKGLVAGDNLIGHPGVPDFVFKDITQNMMPVYQLLPSSLFVSIYNDIFSGSRNYDSFYYDYTKQALNTSGYITSHEQTQDYILNNHNANMYNNAQNFRHIIETGSIGSNTLEFRIVGYGWLTIINTIKKDQGSKTKYELISTGGDGVIPLKSADMNGIGNAKIYLYESHHADILAHNGVIDRVKNIILHDADDPSDVYTNAMRLRGYSVTVQCPVDLIVYDNDGNIAFVDSEGRIINTIDELSYYLIEDTKVLFVPDGLEIQVVMNGYDSGYMDLAFTRYDMDLPQHTKALHRVEITPSTQISFNLNGSVADASTVGISYDLHGDGQTQTLFADVHMTNVEAQDYVAPETVIGIDGVEINGWYANDVVVSLLASDYGPSGGVVTKYSLNAGNEMIYVDPVVISGDGEHYIEYYSLDKAGNYELPQSYTIKIDTLPPTSPSLVVSTMEWTSDDVVIEIQDGYDSGSGVWKSQYKINTGDWLDYTLPVPIQTEGITEFYARTMDNAGNNSAEVIVEVKIDKSASTLPAILPAIDGWVNADIAVTIVSGEDYLSGVFGTQYKINDASDWSNYVDSILLDQEGVHTVTARTIDNVGNISGTEVQQYNIDKTPPTAPTIETSHTDWTASDVTVGIVSGTDSLSGIDKIQYRMGEAGNWIDYSGFITISEPGEHVINARNIDFAGNSSESSTIVRIDKTAPTAPTIGVCQYSCRDYLKIT